MPIRPELRHHYGPAWRVRREEILARAGHRCECIGECGSAPGHRGGRCNAPDRSWIMRDREYRALWRPSRSGARGPGGARAIQVVLTVAHVDHNPANNAEHNLRAWCRRCHLMHDRAHHLANARLSRSRKAWREARESGQLDLFGAEELPCPT